MGEVVTTKQEIYDAYLAGESARSLAARQGISYQRIYQIIREARGLPAYPARRSTAEDPLRRHLWDVHRWRDAPKAWPDGWPRIKDPTCWHAFEHEHEEANWGERHSHDD